MKKNLTTRLLSVIMVAVLLVSCLVPISGTASTGTASLRFTEVNKDGHTAFVSEAQAEEIVEKADYSPEDIVRVSIFLHTASTLDSGYPTDSIAHNEAATAYRSGLKRAQQRVTASIEKVIRGKLNVVWNLTLAANLISANVKFGQIAAIEKVPGVREVVIENRYEPDVADKGGIADPNMGTSGAQIGSLAAWSAGYTGVGCKVAVIDTGTDTDHQSFSESGYNHSMSLLAEAAGMSLEAYKASVGVLTSADVADVADRLNAKNGKLDTSKTYVSDKLPFAYNYADANYTVDHDHDSQGEHGSHVAGIAAANAYIPTDDGTFVKALDSCMVQGVAPDAQIVTMKVFGESGGAYDSDYMAAIEDAIVLGCDSVNLSLGSGSAGFSRAKGYEALMNSLTEKGVVVVMSAGNSGMWAENSSNGTGYLYGDDVSFHTGGSPGSFTNSLGTASVENDGTMAQYVSVSGHNVFYTESYYTNAPISSIAGEYAYIFIDGYGTNADFAALREVLAGKVVFCSRGSNSFYQKAEAAVNNGAVATFIYNNQAGAVNMDLSGYTKTAPCVSITREDADLIRTLSTPVYNGDGKVSYYTGSILIGTEPGCIPFHSKTYTMSSFSSWGVPGSLQIKPEITAPGGSIYSVNGSVPGGKAYEIMSGTSMASPQVAGMMAVLKQYIRQNKLAKGPDSRHLAMSLLMSTAVPLIESDSGSKYSVLRQGAGLANIGNAITSDSYITMQPDATAAYADGKVKAELGDDPDRTGVYTFGFTVNDLSGTAKRYTVTSEFFTQDLLSRNGEMWLNTRTVPIGVYTGFTLNGVAHEIDFDCDLTGDGRTTSADVQVILDYVSGNLGAIDTETADVDGDGAVTTADAQMLLDALKIVFEVPANGCVEVQVTVELSEETKKDMEAHYANGAYVEGYVYVSPEADDEGTVGSAHSIPVLGFYGNWSDPSMFDRATFRGTYYGGNKKPYTGVTQTNFMTVRYAGDASSYRVLGNPYILENEYHADRMAISNTTTLYRYRLSLIRNAAAVVFVVINEDGKLLYSTAVNEQIPGAYYSSDSGWNNTYHTITMNTKVGTLDLHEGEKITCGIVAIPEYYEVDGTLTTAQIEELISKNVLGKGSYLMEAFTVDNTAPALVSVSKDLLTGELTVVARDNRHIAAIMVDAGKGDDMIVTQPCQDTIGESCSVRIGLTDQTAAEEITVTVADYAGNEAVYTINYGGDPVDYSGRMYGFTSSNYNGSGLRWVQIDPAKLYYNSASDCAGMTKVSSSDLDVYAAEYVDGYVFFASDSAIYSAKQGDWANYRKVTDFPEGVNRIWDMAFNYQDKKLYALDDKNNVYTVDLVFGTFEKTASITITNPLSTSATYKILRTLTIDDAGNFYTTNSGYNSYVFLYRFTLADIVDGAIMDLPPVNNTPGGCMVTADMWCNGNAALTYDHDLDIIYLAAGYSAKDNGDVDNELWVVDPETGKAAHPNTLNAQFYAHVVGLYVVPSTDSIIPDDESVSNVTLNVGELTLLKGAAVSLQANVYPWTVRNKGITWCTTDASVVTVADGRVTAVNPGTAIVTAVSHADPTKSASCRITVEKIPEIKLSGMVFGTDGKPAWTEFYAADPENYTALANASTYIGGSLFRDTIYAVSNNTIFGIDADTFHAVSHGNIAADWQFADAAPMASNIYEEFGTYKLIAPCFHGTYLELLDPDTGSLTYWSNFAAFYRDDPMAVIAFAGETEYAGHPAGAYYVMTESGELWLFVIYNGNYLERQDLGATGLDLRNVSLLGEDKASMVYDAESGYLAVATHHSGDPSAELYLVDPESMISAMVGTFGDNVWPVLSLYQYNRITELTLTVEPASLEMYVNGSAVIEAKVKPASYTGGVTFTSDNEEIAAVDENGTVTGIGAGRANITVTTVDTNEAGEQISAVLPVVVEEKLCVDATVNGLIGGDYVQIDLNDLSTSRISTAYINYNAGGMAGGKLYGMYGSHIISNADGRAYSLASWPDCIAVDMANFPGFHANGTTYENAILYPSTTNHLVKFDPADQSIKSWDLRNAGMDLCALTYAGSFTDNDGDNHIYYALDTDGTLYTIYVYADSTGSDLTLSHLILGNIGVRFPDRGTVSMSYIWDGTDDGLEGLVIVDGRDMSMYWVADPSTADNCTAGVLGKLEGSYACSLYTDRDSTVSISANPAHDRKTVGGATHAIMSLSVDALTAKAVSVNETPVNKVTGSPNATAKADPQVLGTIKDETLASDNVVQIVLTEDMPVKNGLIQISYDSKLLSPIDVSTAAEMYSIKIDKKNAVITLAYAGTNVTAAGDPLASVRFQYSGICVSTTVTVVTLERNNETSLDEAAMEITFDHDWSEWITNVEPACATDGKQSRICAVCGKVETRVIPAFGHDWSQWVIASEPTCLDTGVHERICNTCGLIAAEDLPALGHAYGEWTVTRAATCTEAGEETMTCANCDAKLTRATALIAHISDNGTVTAAPTCTETGVKTYKCTVCAEILKLEEIVATGHSYGDWTVTKAATCTAAGEETMTCANCEAKLTRATDLIAHISDNGTVTTAPTCTETGVKTYKCTVCAEILELEEIAATGHSYGEWTVTTEADCQTNGVETRTCAACGRAETHETAKSFENCPSKAFTDVVTSKWYHAGIDYVVENSIMNGVSETKFAPDTIMSRAQLVTVLYRMAGAPVVTGICNFTDVKAGAYYYDAVVWAAENEIVNGTTETAFSPNANITREQMVTILYRYAKFRGKDVTTDGDVSMFSDAASISAYAVNAVAWAVSKGILEGVDNSMIAPKRSATRAQVATIIMRFIASETV